MATKPQVQKRSILISSEADLAQKTMAIAIKKIREGDNEKEVVSENLQVREKYAFLFGPEADKAREDIVRLTKECQERNKERAAYEQERELAHQNREKIIQNAAWDKENDVYYQSIGRHDYITWKNNCGAYMIDGGREYFRSGGWNNSCEPLYLTNNSRVSDVIAGLLWGSYGKDGKQPLTWRPIRFLETDHLLAILQNVTFPNPSDISVLVILEVLKQRGVEIPEAYRDKTLTIYHVFRDG